MNYEPSANGLVLACRKLVNNPAFQNFITGVILLAGALVGIETYPTVMAQYGGPLHMLNHVIVAIFLVEVVAKLISYGSKWYRFFTDGWNIFDFVIVVIALAPIKSDAVAVLRLLRLLRVLRLVRALPGLQILVGALIKSIPSMGYVGVLLGMVFYVYGVAGVTMFGHNDPVHFGSIPQAMLTMFGCVTGEGWVDVMYTQMYGCAGYGYGDFEGLCTNSDPHPLGAPLYFCSFMMIGAMVMLNLFIGVITNGMEETRAENDEMERAARGEGGLTVGEELLNLQEDLLGLQERLAAVAKKANSAG